MTETAIMREILCRLCELEGALFWRVNVGVFRTPDGRTKIRIGLPGQADIAGIFRGRHVEVEVKTEKGRLSKQQERWKAAVESAGGAYVVAKNPADVLTALAALTDARLEGQPTRPNTQPACEPHAGNGEARS